MDKYLESSEFYDKRYKNVATSIVLPIFLFLIFLLFFSLFSKKENSISNSGIISNNSSGKIISVSMISSNESLGIKKNQKARFIVPGNQYINHPINGTVDYISTKPIMKNGKCFYQIGIKLDSDKRYNKYLKIGIQGNNRIILNSKTYFDYYKDYLFNK